MRRVRAGVAVAMAVVLSACASDADPAQSTPVSTDPPALSAEIVQERGDVADGVVAIAITNASDAAIVVDHAEYRSSALTEPLVGGDDASIPAGATRALRGELPRPTCDGAPLDDAVIVVLDDGTEVRLDPGDPYDQIATLTDAPCTRLEVARVATIAWLPVEVPDPPLGADAIVRLEVTPTGEGTLEVVSVAATVLLALVGPDGARAETTALGVAVGPGDAPATIAFAVRPGRCDAHAIAEDKQGTILDLQVVLDGEPRVLQLLSDDATRAALLAYVADACGLG